MVKDLVTVVIPVYNHEKYILSAIESVLSQDYPNIELIVINDGSTDGTDEVIKGFLKSNGEVFKYIAKKNEGVGKTMALGLSEASGEYFCELCSDDLLTPSSIKKRWEFINQREDIDVVFGSLMSIDSDGKPLGEIIRDKEAYSSDRHNFSDFMKRRAIYTIHAGLYRRDRLRSIGGFHEGFFTEDVHLNFLLPLFAKIASIDEQVVCYRQHDTNISSGKPLWMREEKVKSLEIILNLPNLNKIYVDDVKKYLFIEYMKYIKAGLKGGLKKEELKSILSKAFDIKQVSLKAWYYKLRLA